MVAANALAKNSPVNAPPLVLKTGSLTMSVSRKTADQLAKQPFNTPTSTGETVVAMLPAGIVGNIGNNRRRRLEASDPVESMMYASDADLSGTGSKASRKLSGPSLWPP